MILVLSVLGIFAQSCEKEDIRFKNWKKNKEKDTDTKLNPRDTIVDPIDISVNFNDTCFLEGNFDTINHTYDSIEYKKTLKINGVTNYIKSHTIYKWHGINKPTKNDKIVYLNYYEDKELYYWDGKYSIFELY